MIQIIEQSTEEKMAMYMKLSKKELAIMLISCNNALDSAIKNCNLFVVSNSVCPDCNGDGQTYGVMGFSTCKLCNGKG